MSVALGRVTLFSTEKNRVCFANLYAHIFQFFADAVDWYGSSSWRMWSLLGCNEQGHSAANILSIVKITKAPNKGYYDTFQQQITTIKKLSSEISDTATLGMQAELRDLHLDVRDIKRKQRIGLEGQARLDAERDIRDEEFRQALLAKEQQRNHLATGKSSCNV